MTGEQRRPWVTVLTTAITTVVSAIGIAQPDVVRALERSPQLWQEGQWWRLLSPVLINPEGWQQFASNMVGLVVIGATVELWLGARIWLSAFLAGTLAGEVAGLAWQPVGAGSSVAICGLLGALAVGLWGRVATVPARCGAALLLAMAALLTYAQDLHGPPILAGAVVAIVATHATGR